MGLRFRGDDGNNVMTTSCTPMIKRRKKRTSATLSACARDVEENREEAGKGAGIAAAR
jgi:hypothetical protein